MLENLIGQSTHVLPNALPLYWLIILPTILVLIARKFFNLPLFIIILTITLPSLIHSNSGSLSFGLMLSSLIIFACSYSFSGIKIVNHLLPRKFIIFTVSLFVILFFHGFLTFQFYSDTFHLNRFAVSFAGLFILIAAAFIFVHNFSKLNSNEVKKIMQWVWYFVIFLTILVLIRFAVFSPVYKFDFTTLAIFSENSHFVLACLPFFLFKFITSKSPSRLVILLTLIFLAFALRSTTLIIGIGLCCLIMDSSIINRKTIFYYFLLLFIFLYVYFTFFHSQLSDINPIRYILDRIFDFFKPVTVNTNMSSLALFKDWHEAFINFSRTKGFGIGYQQSGIHGFQSYMSDLIYLQSSSSVELAKEDIVPWNIKFESFAIAPKLISELGILGLLAITFYLRYFVESFIYLRDSVATSNYLGNEIDILFHSIYILFFLSLFIRGTGYFSVATFFFLSSVIYLFFLKKNK